MTTLQFFIPFVIFIVKGMIKKEMVPQFIAIFFIGALQGLVGWLMVASGLNDDMLFVNYFLDNFENSSKRRENGV